MNQIFSLIKERISIFDVVSEYATLKKAGTYWKGCCPFHHEKTASFTVSPHKDIFYCFGCHSGGDVISFIAKIENCSQIEAAKFLIERYKIDIPAHILHQETGKNVEQKNSYFELCKKIAFWCNENLQKAAHAREYLAKRGISNESIAHYLIGYFPGGSQAMRKCLDAMKQHSILAQDLIQANIIAENKNFLYSPFEDRIIFPIRDHLGRFCGFGGRIFNPNDNRPKYYNSKENEFFNKGSLLFGFDLAKKQIQETEKAFLVEGYMDCIAMAQYGYHNTVATLGTACTAQHLKHLNRYAQELLMIYDSDNAGKQALLRLTHLCWQTNLELKVVELPSSFDPASFLVSNKDLAPLITSAKDIFDFFITSAGQDFASKSLGQKVNLARKLIDLICTVSDPLKQDFLLQKASLIMEIPLESLKRELSQKESPTPQNIELSIKEEQVLPEKEGLTLSADLLLEKKVFCAIMHNMTLLKKSEIEYVIEYMPEPLKSILIKAQEILSQGDTPSLTHLFDLLQESDKKNISQLLLEHEEQKIDNELFDILLTQLHKKWWKHIVQSTQHKLAKARQENDTIRVEQIVRDFLDFKQRVVSITVK